MYTRVPPTTIERASDARGGAATPRAPGEETVETTRWGGDVLSDVVVGELPRAPLHRAVQPYDLSRARHRRGPATRPTDLEMDVDSTTEPRRSSNAVGRATLWNADVDLEETRATRSADVRMLARLCGTDGGGGRPVESLSIRRATRRQENVQQLFIDKQVRSSVTDRNRRPSRSSPDARSPTRSLSCRSPRTRRRTSPSPPRNPRAACAPPFACSRSSPARPPPT